MTTSGNKYDNDKENWCNEFIDYDKDDDNDGRKQKHRQTDRQTDRQPDT